MRTAQRGPLPWRVACEPQGHLRNATREANRLRAHEGDGAIIFNHACKLGLEGIVSKHRDLPYRSGRVKSWIKLKNPASPAMLRIVEDGAW
jgi:ATP-dependent DNA ligase